MNQSPPPVAAASSGSSSSRLWESSEEAHAAFLPLREPEAEASQCADEEAAEAAPPFLEKAEKAPLFPGEAAPSPLGEEAAVATNPAEEAQLLSSTVEAAGVVYEEPASFPVDPSATAATQQGHLEQQISAAFAVAAPATAGGFCHSTAAPAAVKYTRSSLLVDSAVTATEDSSSNNRATCSATTAAEQSSLSNVTAASQRESTSRSLSNCRTDAEDNNGRSVVVRAATEKPLVSERAGKATDEESLFAAAAAAAASQPTPFGVNRYVLLLLHVLYVIATARVLFGWPHLSSMLFRSEAFAWLCVPQNSSFSKEVWVANLRAAAAAAGTRYLCVTQDNAVQLLFTVGIATAFCCSLLAGLLLDWRGPRLCATAGQLLNTTGWLLFAFSSESCQTYIPAVICLALGADAGYLPSFAVSKLFPGHESLIVVTLAAAMSASFSIPTLMDLSWRNNLQSLNFQKVCLLYAALGTGLCAVLALFLFPKKGYKSDEDFRKSMQQQLRNPTQQQQPEEQQQEGDAEEQRLLQNKAQQLNSSSCSVQQGKEELLQVHVDSCAREATTTTEAAPAPVEEEASRLSLKRQLRSQYFIFFFVYWPLNALFYNFYMTSAEHLFNVAVNDLLGILGPLSMIPSLVLGKVADVWGVQTLVLVIASAGASMYLFALFPGQVACYYVSAFLSCLYVSNFSGQMYAFVSDTFSPAHFGKVVGIISAAGGLLALLRIPLADPLTLTVFKGNYTSTCYIMFAVTLFCLLLAVRLFFLKRKQPKAYLSSACLSGKKQVAVVEDKATERQQHQQPQEELGCRISRTELLQEQQLTSVKGNKRGSSSSNRENKSRKAQYQEEGNTQPQQQQHEKQRIAPLVGSLLLPSDTGVTRASISQA